MIRLATLDIGSLTVRGAVAESLAPGSFRIISRRQEITGLGQGLTQKGELSQEAMDRTRAAAVSVVGDWLGLGVERSLAVATQAVRQAVNGRDFLKTLEDSLDLPVQLLTPAEEANLTLAGVLTALAAPFKHSPALLVFDLGGGSIEFILAPPGSEPVFAGLPLGVLTVSRSHPLGDPPHSQAVAALERDLKARLDNFYQEHFSSLLVQPPLLVGTAGAVTTLAAMFLKMTEYDANRINNLILSTTQIEDMAALLARLPGAERARLPAVGAARGGVMVAGALIVLAILRVFRQDSLVVCDAGLLEGVLSRLSRDREP